MEFYTCRYFPNNNVVFVPTVFGSTSVTTDCMKEWLQLLNALLLLFPKVSFSLCFQFTIKISTTHRFPTHVLTVLVPTCASLYLEVTVVRVPTPPACGSPGLKLFATQVSEIISTAERKKSEIQVLSSLFIWNSKFTACMFTYYCTSVILMPFSVQPKKILSPCRESASARTAGTAKRARTPRIWYAAVLNISPASSARRSPAGREVQAPARPPLSYL